MWKLSGSSSTLFVKDNPGFVLQKLPLSIEPIFLTNNNDFLLDGFNEVDIGDPVGYSYFYTIDLPTNSLVKSAMGYLFSSTALSLGFNNIFQIVDKLYIQSNLNINTLNVIVQLEYLLQSNIVLPTTYNTVEYVSIGCKEVSYTINNGVLSLDIDEYIDTNATIFVGLNITLPTNYITRVVHFISKNYVSLIEWKEKTYTKQVGSIPNIGQFIQFANSEYIKLYEYP